MDSNQFKGLWKQIKGHAKEKWGKLTRNDYTQVKGKRDQFLGRLQERYGWKKQEAREKLGRWEKSISKKLGSKTKRRKKDE